MGEEFCFPVANVRVKQVTLPTIYSSLQVEIADGVVAWLYAGTMARVYVEDGSAFMKCQFFYKGHHFVFSRRDTHTKIHF